MGQAVASSAHMVQVSIPASQEWTDDLSTVSNGPPTSLVVQALSKGPKRKTGKKESKKEGEILRKLYTPPPITSFPKSKPPPSSCGHHMAHSSCPRFIHIFGSIASVFHPLIPYPHPPKKKKYYCLLLHHFNHALYE